MPPARIMNKGTNENILTQLGITSDQFVMITILYTVSNVPERRAGVDLS